MAAVILILINENKHKIMSINKHKNIHMSVAIWL